MNRTPFSRAVATGVLLAMVAAMLMAFPAGTARAESAYSHFTVYYPLITKLDYALYPVRHLVPKTTTPVKAAVQALIAGIPGSPFLALPKDTEVEIISIKDGVCTVNFSNEITKVNVGSGGEGMVLSAIVATLGQFEGVDAVLILVDGQPMETLAGHVDITGPLPDANVYDNILQVLEDAYQHWSGGAVGVLQALSVLDGYPDGTYKPDNKVSRAEFVKMLVEGLRLPYASGETVPFKDVTGQWHEDYISRALASGLLKASDYGENLKPDEVIPREEMAGLLVNAKAAYLAQHPEVDYQEQNPAPVLSDLSLATEKYRAAIQESTQVGFLRGFPDGTFRPKEGVTRGESATVITRVLGMAETADPTYRHVIRMSPLQGAKWDGGSLNALGAASAFEGNVNWRISGSGGEILFSYVTTTMGMGWGLYGLHVDAALFADRSPSELAIFLESMEDGHEFSKVTLPLVK